jgi:hypothetical protein
MTYQIISQYLTRNYNVNLKDLGCLSINQLADLTMRFPYKIAVILKYKRTHESFPNKLFASRSCDCYDCGSDLVLQENNYQVVERGFLELVCQKCFIKRKVKQPVFDLEGLM